MRYENNAILSTGAVNVVQKPGETIEIYKQILRDRKHLKLSTTARFMHCLLRALGDTKGWHITVKGLATEMGVSKPTVIKCLKELREAQLVETDLTYKPGTKIIDGYLWTIYPLPKPMYELRMNR